MFCLFFPLFILRCLFLLAVVLTQLSVTNETICIKGENKRNNDGFFFKHSTIAHMKTCVNTQGWAGRTNRTHKCGAVCSTLHTFSEPQPAVQLWNRHREVPRLCVQGRKGIGVCRTQIACSLPYSRCECAVGGRGLRRQQQRITSASFWSLLLTKTVERR